MSSLERAILDALAANGESVAANRAYLEFTKANFIIPIRRESAPDAPEVLFLTENNEHFLPVFTSMEYLDTWAAEIAAEISILRLSGVDLLKGIGDQVHVCLDPPTPHGKVFSPAEIARMKGIVLKFFQA